MDNGQLTIYNEVIEPDGGSLMPDGENELQATSYKLQGDDGYEKRATSNEPRNLEQRDYSAEAKILIQQNPELKDEYMTEEVFQSLVSSEKPLAEAFRDYKQGKQLEAFEKAKLDLQLRDEEIVNLRKELEILRQNAEAAARAPVTPVSEGGSPLSEAEGNPFLKGLFGL